MVRWSLGGELVGAETPWWRDDRIPATNTTVLTILSIFIIVRHVVKLRRRDAFKDWALVLAGNILGQDIILKVPLSSQAYKQVPACLMLGVTLRRTSILSRGD